MYIQQTTKAYKVLLNFIHVHIEPKNMHISKQIVNKLILILCKDTWKLIKITQHERKIKKDS